MRDQRERLVFIDETGTTTKMTRLRGRSTKGTRLNSKAPFGHWGTQTFVAGLKCDGLIAPWVIDAPMNRVIFETYVETQLAPALKPGDVVILDNLSSHKSERAEKAIRAQGAWLLFLPPYSPDLNPCIMAPAGQGVGSDLVNRSVAAMYTASEDATRSLRALMNIRLENRSHSIERSRRASD